MGLCKTYDEYIKFNENVTRFGCLQSCACELIPRNQEKYESVHMTRLCGVNMYKFSSE
jgi:hypothetical protein